MRASIRHLGVVFAAVTSCGGCAASNKDMLHFLQEHKSRVSATEYRIGIPDAIAIGAPKIIEIDGEMRRLQPDGKINLRLLGEVMVVGMTAKEIAAKLEVLASRYYVDPKVDVRVVSYESKKYYVHGQVGAAGSRPYTGRDTLLDAVLASGVTFQSWTTRVRVTRPAHDKEPARIIRVNVDRMLKKGQWDQNILLEPNDVLYVPPTPVAWMSHRIQELIYPITPAIQAYVAPAYLTNAGDVYNSSSQTNFSVSGGGNLGNIPRP